MPRIASDSGPARILEPPPEATAAELQELEAALDEKIPDKVLDRNLLVGTWNIRAFGDLTTEWERDPDHEPKRNLSDALAIAEILSRFDVVAVQEVRSNLRALRHVLKALGPNWGFILTDVNRSHAGNYERLAFLYDSRRVRPSGLAAELVIPEEERKKRKIRKTALAKQFVRTPYAVSFACGGQTFILVTLHVIYGSGASDRTGELRGIAEWLAAWAKRTSEDFSQNLICLGDFNVDREGDANYEALTSSGLKPPAELAKLSRSIYDKLGEAHHYDQIAWFRKEPGGRKAQLTLGYEGRGHAGRFEWTKHLLVDAGMDNDEKAARISDHYPLWVEFGL